MFLIHANLIPMEGTEYSDGWIEFSHGKILALGPMESLSAVPDCSLDLCGATVLPGFIDAHTHLGMFGDGLTFEGEDGNEETDPVTPQLRAIDAVYSFDRCFSEALDAGVTTVLTGPGSANPIAGEWLAMKTGGDSPDEMAILAPAGMKFSLGENPKNIYNAKNLAPMTRMGTTALIREQLKKAERYRLDMERAAGDEDMDPPEYDIKCEALLPVLRGELKAFFHAHRADDILTALRISREFRLDAVIVHATEGWQIAPLLAKEHAKVIVGPIIADRGKPELRNQTPANAALLAKAGIPLAICTDHPENPIQYLPLAAAVCVKAGLPHTEALRAITFGAAEIAGISGRVGSLAPGKDADLVIYSRGENPFDVMSSPKAVFLNGELVRGIL